MPAVPLKALRPYLRRVAAALSGLTPQDREELVAMLELGALIREARYLLMREIDQPEPGKDEE